MLQTKQTDGQTDGRATGETRNAAYKGGRIISE